MRPAIRHKEQRAHIWPVRETGFDPHHVSLAIARANRALDVLLAPRRSLSELMQILLTEVSVGMTS